MLKPCKPLVASAVVAVLTACGGGGGQPETLSAAPAAQKSAGGEPETDSDSQPLTSAMLRERFPSNGTARATEDE